MASEYVDMRNLKFLVNEVHRAAELTEFPYFADHESETLDMMLDAAKQLADDYMFPFLEECDRFGVLFEDGKVTVHPQVAKVMKAMGENGWIGSTFSYEDGGMQLPHMIAFVAEYIFEAANNNLTGYPGLTGGAARLIVSFGSDELKETYVPNMMAGKWQGTMALTEPQAGSSLSDITTSATPQKDGSYKIQGTKIFISSGDYESTENVVHLMLARIDGAPKGTKGISLFVVPKHRLENDQLVANDVITAGIFHKMGQNGYVTTHLSMGDSDNCYGYLVGEAHRGLSYMFQMMNGARIAVGIGASSIASAAYHASLQYANERPQGRRWKDRSLEQPQTLIINHPDIRRMLLTQRAISEGAISLAVQCARYSDLMHVSDGDEKKKYDMLLEILTPVCKTYPSEEGIRSVSNGIQILGGYGYCKDFPLEQYYRDIRIMALYEGTTGIQSLDLLGRKVVMENGAAFRLLMGEIQETLQAAGVVKSLEKYCQSLGKELKRLADVTKHLAAIAQKGDVELFLSDATVYMELFGLVSVAWQWLKQGLISEQALSNVALSEGEQQFYQGKIHVMKFFFVYELPRSAGLAETLLSAESLTVLKETEAVF